MPNRLSSFVKKMVVGKDNNLVSLDDPYEVMNRLLKGCRITGIIDAGASDGRVSRKLLRRFHEAHVYAFEPNYDYRDALEQYAKKDLRFHPQFLALSDVEGAAKLYVTSSAGNVSLLAPAGRLCEISPEGASVQAVSAVDTVTIDRWAGRTGNIQIQLMKLDIQGAELKALRGGAGVLQKSTLAVYTEIWFNQVYEGGALYGEIDAFLRENGFELYDIFKPGYNRHGQLVWANALYLHSKLLV